MQSSRVTIAVCVGIVALASLAAGSAVATGPDVAAGGELQSTTAGFVAAQNATATAQASGNAQLNESIVNVERGEAATLRVLLENTTEATVVLGGEDGDDNVTITVTDGNGDGEVPLEFDTGPIGMERTRFVPTDDGDDYGTLNATTDPDDTFPAGDYPIDVYAGHGVAGEPTGVGTLVVTEATPPPNASIDYEGDAVTLRPASGQVVEGTTELEAGRKLMLRLRSSGASPFLKTREVTVGTNGSFAASFDLDDVEAPANATVTVSLEGERLAGPVDVAVVEARGATGTPETTTAPEETTTPGQPGFGVGIVLVALVITIAGAQRRLN